MRPSRLVPALAALLLAQQAAAADGIAPVTVLDSGDALLSASVNDADPDPRAALALTQLAGSSFDYSGGAWSDFASLGIEGSAGIAIVGQLGTGNWQYDVGGGWLNLPACDEDSAFLLPLAGTRLRFVPSVAGAATATLTWRLWDGSDGSALGQTSTANPDPLSGLGNGGSPTAFGADTRVLTVTVLDNSGNSGAPYVTAYDGLDALNQLQVRTGQTASVTVYAEDPDAADVLAWSATSIGYGGAGTIIDQQDYDGYSVLTFAGSTAGTDQLDITITDLNGNLVNVSIPVVVSDNNDPTVVFDGTVDINGDPSPPLTVTRGGSLIIPLLANDADGDTLTWSAMLSMYSTGGVTADGAVVTYTPDASGGDETVYVTVEVSDGQGGLASVTLPVSVVGAAPNQPPVIEQVSAGSFGIVGQPFEAVLRVSDPDDDVDALRFSASEPGATATRLAAGVWRLRWRPDAAEYGRSVTLTVRDPHGAQDSDGLYLDYVAAPTPVRLTAALPRSSDGNIVYGAIAPGYQGGFSLLNGFLEAAAPGTARAFWWSGSGYGELPGSVSDPLRNAVFLASTERADLAFTPPTQPAPFAIVLRAGRWSFFGIPPLLLDTYGGSETYHDWSAFELQELDGTVVDAATKLAALAPGGAVSDSETQPYAWNWSLSPAAYERSPALDSGVGYWLRNRLDRDLRLVRTPYGMGSPPAAAAGVRRAAAAAATDLPPAPPSGRTAQAAEPGGGSCGAGGLAGLLLAGLALVGLRPRRRG